MSETDIGSDGYISPLKTMIHETHEIFQELVAVGYPESIAVLIISNILSDAIANRVEKDDEDDDDNDDEDPDDDEFAG